MAQVKIIETPKSYYSKIESKRDVGIDIVKSIAILSVVGVHFF